MKKNMFLAAMTAVGAIMLSGSALAQDQSTTTTTTTVTQGTTMVPTVNWGNRISVGDEIFLMDVVHANAREIILSRIAEHNADSHGVAEFAHHMLEAHLAMQNQLLGTYGSMAWMHNWQTSLGRRMGDHVENYDAQASGTMNNNMDNDMGKQNDDDWNHGGWGGNWNKADTNWHHIYPSDWNDIHTLQGLTGYAFDKQYIDFMANDHAMLLDKLNMHARETRNTDIQALITSAQPTVQGHLEEARTFAFQYSDPFNVQRPLPWIQ